MIFASRRFRSSSHTLKGVVEQNLSKNLTLILTGIGIGIGKGARNDAKKAFGVLMATIGGVGDIIFAFKILSLVSYF